MDAILAAGGIPQADEPLYSYSGGEPKALIDMAGKPMIQWVLDALSSAKTIERVVIIGLTHKAHLACTKPLSYVPGRGKLLDNVRAAAARVVELNPQAKYVLFVSSDIPAITGDMVDWLVRTCQQTKDDLYYNVIRREDMERRFPAAKRTYVPLKAMEVCGGDMNLFRTNIVNQNLVFWNRLAEARKNPVEQARLIGADIALKFLLRQLTIDDVIERVAGKVGLKGRAIICPYPEIGMDVDKPHQLEILRADLARSTRRASAGAKPKGKSRLARKNRLQKRSFKARRRSASRPRSGRTRTRAP